MTQNTSIFIIIVFWIASFLPNNLVAQEETVRVFLFGATQDDVIGKGVEKSLSLIKELLDELERTGEIQLKRPLPYIGEQLTLESIEEVVSYLEKLETELVDDTVILYFIGHGFDNIGCDTPNLLFYPTTRGITSDIWHQHSINLQQLHNRIKYLQNRPRLICTIGEACHTSITTIRNNRKYNIKKDKREYDIMGVSTIPLINPNHCKSLFTQSQGDILLYSSLEGYPSYISDEDGGIFTRAFIRAIRQVLSHIDAIKWKDIYNMTIYYTNHLSDSLGLIQLPKGKLSIINKDPDNDIISIKTAIINGYQTNDTILVKPTTSFFDISPYKYSRELKPIKKGLKRMLKGKTSHFTLKKYLIENDTILKKLIPLNYYWLKAYFAEGDNNLEAYENYATAYYLYDKKKYTYIDANIFDKFWDKIDKKKHVKGVARRIKATHGMNKWLKEKYFQFAQYFNKLEQQESKKLKKFELNVRIIYKKLGQLGQEVELFKNKPNKNNEDVIKMEQSYQTQMTTLKNEIEMLKMLVKRQQQKVNKIREIIRNVNNLQNSNK